MKEKKKITISPTSLRQTLAILKVKWAGWSYGVGNSLQKGVQATKGNSQVREFEQTKWGREISHSLT